MAETARHEPSDVHVIVHTDAAAALGAVVDCVQVLPPSAVLRKVPIGVPVAAWPDAAGAVFPPTLTTQCNESPQLNRPI